MNMQMVSNTRNPTLTPPIQTNKSTRSPQTTSETHDSIKRIYIFPYHQHATNDLIDIRVHINQGLAWSNAGHAIKASLHQ